MTKTNTKASGGTKEHSSSSVCSTEYFYVVMLAQKFEEHFEAFGGTIPVRMSKGCPKRFLVVFDDRQEAVEWAGDESKVRMAQSL